MEIGFIDYSHEERNRILSTLKLLGDQTALDELGIGVVRDAYADILFPGISTLQTRAKYYVLLLYLFQSAREQAEKGRLRSGQELLRWINESEDRLAAALTNNCPPGEIGIIGSNAYRSKRSVKVKPSTIYWSGLRTFGIFLGGNASISAACRMICANARMKAAAEIKSDGESFDDPTATDQGTALFSPLLPDYDYEKYATTDLTAKEAKFLSERIQRSLLTSESLLAFFVKHNMISSDFESVPVDMLSKELCRDYLLARDFSRFIYGAHIRYNVIYSEYHDETMTAAFHAWRDRFLSEPFELRPVLDRVSCPPALKHFCQDYLDAVIHNNTTRMDDLIIRREVQVKGARSKLRKPKEYRYDPAHPVHFYQLNYRFDRASVIIRDILKGLEGEQDV